MPIIDCLWDLFDDPDGNIRHIARNDLTPDDVEHALATQYDASTSASTGRPIAFGFTEDGRHVAVVYEVVDENVIYPVTAYTV